LRCDIEITTQIFYTYSGYFLVSNPGNLSNSANFIILLFGLLSLFLNYAADYQKESFKLSNGECYIWGRKAKYIPVEYTASDGKTKKKSKLMLSGFWGVSRHMNYVFELMLALSWSLPSLGNSADLGLARMSPFFYFFFLLILLVHRTFRDEEKCHGKYGEGYTKYCKEVPYRMIPFVF